LALAFENAAGTERSGRYSNLAGKDGATSKALILDH